MFVRALVASLILGGAVARAVEHPDERSFLLKTDVQITDFEKVAPGEEELIRQIVVATGEQMAKRYGESHKVLRNQHAKSHGCVAAKFTVRNDIDTPCHVGVFANPKSYDAIVRFSNADSRVRNDSVEVAPGVRMHGSRGMAIKVLGVSGEALLPLHGALTQDFVMINSPVFVFANVEDYALASKLIAEHGDDKGPGAFFQARSAPGTTDEQKMRAQESGAIAAKIRSTGTPQPYQIPPTNPVETCYFGAAPFLLGSEHVMRFRVRPVGEDAAGKQPDIENPNYLHEGLVKRLKAGECVRFVFEVQVRSKGQITDTATQIENACREWDDSWKEFADLELSKTLLDEAACESLVFTPWHCLKEHQPLGSINRLRKSVYLESAMIRNLPKEPGALPVGP